MLSKEIMYLNPQPNYLPPFPGQMPFQVGIGLEVNKSITLLGQSSNNTILTLEGARNPNTGSNAEFLYPTRGIVVDAKDVTLSNFSINCNDIEGIVVFNSSCKILGNNIFNSQGDGVSLGFENDIVSLNNVTGCGTGIVMGDQNSIISDNNIENNLIGIDDNSLTSNNTVARNNIIGNLEGLRLVLANQTLVYQNFILDNGIGLDLVGNCSYSKIHNNQIQSNSIGILSNTTLFLNIQPNIPKMNTIGNQIYYNNILSNNQSALILGPTNAIFWGNGNIGNFWSDSTGNVSYVIDQNNIDHHPLSQPLILTQ